jgi:hypothetical protein
MFVAVRFAEQLAQLIASLQCRLGIERLFIGKIDQAQPLATMLATAASWTR